LSVVTLNFSKLISLIVKLTNLVALTWRPSKISRSKTDSKAVTMGAGAVLPTTVVES
jgi:hypothetical protein